MSWIIKDGLICDIDGDGICIEDPSQGGTISNMVIRNCHTGIRIGSSSNTEREKKSKTFELQELIDMIEAKISELPHEDQEFAYKTLENIRTNPNTFMTKRGLKVIHDLALGVTGSTLATMLAPLLGLS